MKKDVRLIIVAAGHNSRFGAPKHFQEIAPGIPNIVNTINVFHKYVDDILILGSTEHQNLDEWKKVGHYKCGKTKVQFIKPGGGDAVALSTVRDMDKFKNTIVVWGDAVFTSGKIIEELHYKQFCLNRLNQQHSFIIPCVLKKNPYVKLTIQHYYSYPELKRVNDVRFSKYDEIKEDEEGYHDQCLFWFESSSLKSTIESTLRYVMNKDGNIIIRNGEYTILDSLKNMVGYLYETDYPTLSYNTQEELNDIRKIFSGSTNPT